MKKQVRIQKDLIEAGYREVSAGGERVICFHSVYPEPFCRMLDQFVSESADRIPVVRSQVVHRIVMEPYAPFLQVLRDRYSGDPEAIRVLLDKAQVYPYHRKLFEAYLLGEVPVRQEELIQDEIPYERDRICESIRNLLAVLAGGGPLVVAVADLHFASPAVLGFILSLVRNAGKSGILFLFSFDRSFHHSTDARNEAWESFVSSVEECSPVIELGQEEISGLHEWPTPKRFDQPSDALRLSLESQAFLCFPEANQAANRALSDAVPAGLRLQGGLENRAIRVLAECAMAENDYESAMVYLENLLESSNALKEESALALTRIRMSAVQMQKHNLEVSRRFAWQALEQAKKSGDKPLLAKALFQIYLLGDRVTTPIDFEQYEVLITLLQELKYENMYSYCCKNGYIYIGYYKTWEKVLEVCREAIRISEKNRNEFGLAVDYHKMGIVHTHLNDFDGALRYFRKSAKIRDRLGYPLEIVRIRNGIGYLATLREDYREAFRHYVRAAKMLGRIRDYNEITVTLYNIALAYFFTGDFQKCGSVIDKVLRIMKIMKMDHIPFQSYANIIVAKGICFAKTGQSLKAIETYNRAFEHRQDITSDSIFFYRLLEAHILWDRGETDKAGNAFRDAIHELDSRAQTQKRLYPLFYLEYGIFLKHTGKAAEASKILARGMEVAAEIGSAYQRRAILSEMDDGSAMVERRKLPALPLNLDHIVEIAVQDITLRGLNRKIREIRFLQVLQDKLLRCANREDLADKTLELVQLHFPADYGLVYLEQQGDWIVLAGFGEGEMDSGSLTGWIRSSAETKQEVLIHIKPADENLPEALRKMNSALCIPLRSGNKVRGALFLATARQEIRLNQDDQEILALAAGQLVVRLQYMEQLEYLVGLSRTDLLTGLANRQHLEARMQEEVARFERYRSGEEGKLSISFISLDQYSYYRNEFGQEAGDAVLRHFSRLLRKVYRDSDFISRFGEELFTVMMVETLDFQAIIPAERLIALTAEQEALEKELSEITGLSVHVAPERRLNCSVGIAGFDFTIHGADRLEVQMNRADMALQDAKRQGPGRVVIWKL